jgi:hypothetical protein
MPAAFDINLEGIIDSNYIITLTNTSDGTLSGQYSIYVGGAIGQAVSFNLSPGGSFTTAQGLFATGNQLTNGGPVTSAGQINVFAAMRMTFTLSNATYTLDNRTGQQWTMAFAGTSTVFSSGTGGSGPVTDYGINPYINDPSGTINATNVRRRLITISDGTSNTILAGHIYYALSDYPLTTPSTTMMPIFAPGTLGTSRNTLGNSSATWLQDGTTATSNQWGAPMAEGGLMAMCDGSVHLFPYSVSLANFLTPDDGNPVNLP